MFWALGCGVGRGSAGLRVQLVSGFSWSQGSAGLRVQLIQKINNKNRRKSLRATVNCGIIKPNRQMKGELVMKYQGIVKNRLSGEVRRTRLYRTYKKAHIQAESLGRRVYGKNYNWEVDVITREDDSRD